MRSRVLAIACLAACNSGQGVDLEVHADGVTFDTVELFVAYDRCVTPDGGDCRGIGWPQTTSRVDGDVFVLKGDERLIRTTTLQGDGAVLHLEAEDGFDDTRAIAIVAFQGTTAVAATVMHDKHIPRHDQEHWYITLDPTDAASTNLAAPTAPQLDHRALAWAREPSSAVPDTTDYAGCFAYQAWNGTDWTTEYFVPESDPDCDGQPPDCDPYWNHAKAGATRCLRRADALPTVCVVGTKVCASETTTTCNIADPVTCIPDAMCECANDPNIATCLQDRFDGPTASNLPIGYCTFVVDPNTTLACNLTGTGEHMSLVVPGMCFAPSATPNAPLAVLRPPTMPFSSGADTLMIGTAKITVHAQAYGTTACLIDLGWAADTAPPTMGGPIFVAVSYGARQVLVPVWIDFDANSMVCPTNVPTCQRVGNWPDQGNPGDTMFLCTAGG